ncbi:MAG: RsmB/NOP family class I SAM-dependent RNA methyltransferase [Cognatishimia sp.]|uniref:RsmB/NOP family class I SAM-dependent RNA methyltransferase n=1 Tax=Cognatishimia sp. TaxID=2211648 RepID=UPI003B8AA723
MTPAARVQTAIELLDPILDGAPAERTLTQWARKSRFAGSKDRAAIRDHIYDVLRRKNTFSQSGGGQSPRHLIIGLLRHQGVDLEDIFSGTGYGPDALTPEENVAVETQDVADLPDWIIPDFQASLGTDFEAIEAALKERAPVILRVNLSKETPTEAIDQLAAEGIETRVHASADTALIVTEGARKIRNSQAYQTGVVELQDAASQAAIALLPFDEIKSTLDYCAGGGGKLLAMAARGKGQFFAHDVLEGRLCDLPERAKRAGIKAQILKTSEIPHEAPFDLVFCDVPCSGTGTWRRDPDAKWKLTRETLSNTLSIQQEILTSASKYVGETGFLGYATCSLLQSENQDQISAFLKENPDWALVYERVWTPLDGCDGFYTALLKRK